MAAQGKCKWMPTTTQKGRQALVCCQESVPLQFLPRKVINVCDHHRDIQQVLTRVQSDNGTEAMPGTDNHGMKAGYGLYDRVIKCRRAKANISYGRNQFS